MSPQKRILLFLLIFIFALPIIVISLTWNKYIPDTQIKIIANLELNMRKAVISVNREASHQAWLPKYFHEGVEKSFIIKYKDAYLFLFRSFIILFLAFFFNIAELLLIPLLVFDFFIFILSKFLT